jgi:hypothetical protein
LNRSGKYINRRAIGLTFSETNLPSVERTGGKGKSFFYRGKEKIPTSGRWMLPPTLKAIAHSTNQPTHPSGTGIDGIGPLAYVLHPSDFVHLARYCYSATSSA